MDDREKAALIGSVVTKRRKEAISTPMPHDGLTIAIGTAPRGLSLASETRLSKAALLYADRVVLYSSAAAMLGSAQALGGMTDDELIAFARQLGPILDADGVNGQAAIDLWEHLRAKRRRSRQEIVMLEGFKRNAREAVAGFAATANDLLEQAGGLELQVGVSAGLIEVDPLVREDDDELLGAYLGKLAEILGESGVHPLFDDETGALVREVVGQGLFEISASANRRGRQAAAATGFIARMPALPRASMDQVIEVRGELSEPLIRFRRAVIRIARMMEADLRSEDLAGETQDLYDSEVAPVLEEIAAAFTSNAYIRELLGVAFGDVKALLAEGAGLVAGVANPAHLSSLASAGLGLAGSVLSPAAVAAWKAREAREAARHEELFFLYRANASLA